MTALNEINNEYINNLSNGIIPVYGFKGLDSSISAKICENELNQYNCNAYYLEDSSIIYGQQLSFSEYLNFKKKIALKSFGEPMYIDFAICVDLFFDVCLETQNTTVNQPELYFAYTFESYFEYVNTISNSNVIHIFGECNNCPNHDISEFIYNDYFDTNDSGYRNVRINQKNKVGKLPAAVHPL
jgi:hypothetical protein